MNHEIQRNPYEQEVKVERRVTMSEGKKRADYAFYLAPDFRKVRFFVEAKKPSVDIRSKDNYFQAIRYGWNGNTPLAVLTDFEQFHILDCRRKPDISHALDTALKQYRFTDYTDKDRFAEIYYLFSREAVAEGAIEKYVETNLPAVSGKRNQQRGLFHVGYQSIDSAFLNDLEEYRRTLARAFKAANPALDSESLTEATQRTLDRLVFLRFLEDKLIEPEPLLKNLTMKPSPWRAFQQERKRLDTTYNGNIFKEHFIDRPTFTVEDSVFYDVCDWLSSDSSPYLFSVVPIHILGSIYERFLGSVIVVEGDTADVQQKIEVRKAGGVYYTPDYIVRYIVENTVGKQIAGKTPDEINTMRFADIACGSGSFLLGVYDELLRYHTKYYNDNPAEARKAKCERDDETGGYRLTLWQKREILLNNLWGVDIDPQAVEVAQLSLYLKLLESETLGSTKDQLTLGGAILPTLTENIVCGNALVEWDIFGDGEMNRKVNPLDFRTAFTKLFRGNGGFDAIVGNPPYIRIQTMQETLPETIPYYKHKYTAAQKGNYDIYVLFIERALQLLHATGCLGYIVPHKFFNAQYGVGIRQRIASGKHLSKVVHFGDEQIFEGATTYTCLLFLTKGESSSLEFQQVDNLKLWERDLVGTSGNIKSDEVTPEIWNFQLGAENDLFSRLRNAPLTLEKVTNRIFQGLKTSADKIYILDYVKSHGELTLVYSPQTQKEHLIESALLHPLIKGGDAKAYCLASTNRRILFPYEKHQDKAVLIPAEKFAENHPKAWEYLLENRDYLENRESGKMKNEQWYSYGRTQALDVMPLPKIFTPDFAPTSSFAYDETGERFFTGGAAGGYGILPTDGFTPLYLLTVLNSRLLEWYLQRFATTFRGGWFSYETRFIRHLPVITPPSESIQEELETFAAQIIEAKKRRLDALTDRDIQFYDRRIADLDRRINEIVYELYQLTDKEIALIENP
ncbi:MAG: Eco57I restriction-modification methylase domain-containing protein [Armatimonadaceae bacterium]